MSQGHGLNDNGLAPVVPIAPSASHSTEPPVVDDSGVEFDMMDGQVVASDAVESDEVDYESAGSLERDLVPVWMTSRSLAAEHATDVLRRSAWSLLFHFVRLPLYLARLVALSPAGVARLTRLASEWVADREEYLDAKAVMRETGRGDVNELNDSHARTVRGRLDVVLSSVMILGFAAVVLLWTMPAWQRITAGACLVLGLGVFGRLATSRAVTERVRYDRAVAPKVTESLLLDALRVAGAEPKGVREIQVIQPPVKIRTGWEAIFTLGVPATTIMDNADKVATVLGRAENCVWLTSHPDEAAGWLRVVVTRKSLRNARMPEWPFRYGGTFNWFHDLVPVGIDETGELVASGKRAISTVYGGIMGAGKTVSMIVQVLGQAVDPRVELHIYDLKGGTDWLDLAGIAHFLRAGSDEEDHQAVVGDLRELNRRMDNRFKTLRTLPDDIRSPKTTSALADIAHLDLHPIVVVIDETQELFDRLVCPDHWKEYTGLVSRLVKKGRAVGITVEAGTQEVKKETLPIAGLCQLRHCHSVQGRSAVDLVLGTGAYGAGFRPDLLTSEDAGIGFHGSGKEIGLCRSYFLDPDNGDVAEVVDRLRTERAALGRLSGMAAGDIEPDVDHEGVFDRLLRLWPHGAERLQWVEIVALFHDDNPEEYPAVGDLTHGIPEDVERAVTALSNQFARYGLDARPIRSSFRPRGNAASSSRRGLVWDDIAAAQARRTKPLQPLDEDLWNIDDDAQVEGYARQEDVSVIAHEVTRPVTEGDNRRWSKATSEAQVHGTDFRQQTDAEDSATDWGGRP